MLQIPENRTESRRLYQLCSVGYPDGVPCQIENLAMEAWWCLKPAWDSLSNSAGEFWNR